MSYQRATWAPVFAASTGIQTGLTSLLLLCRFAAAAQSYLPDAYQVSSDTPAIGDLVKYGGESIALNNSFPMVTFDYGSLVGGFPYVEIEGEPNAAVQIELKYSEPYDGLDQPQADGPW
jgi:hypothetical protein